MAPEEPEEEIQDEEKESFEDLLKKAFLMVDENGDLHIQLKEFKIAYPQGTQEMLDKLGLNEDKTLTIDGLRKWFIKEDGSEDRAKLEQFVADVNATQQDRFDHEFDELMTIMDLNYSLQRQTGLTVADLKHHHEWKPATAEYWEKCLIREMCLTVGLIAKWFVKEDGSVDLLRVATVSQDLTTSMAEEFEYDFKQLFDHVSHYNNHYRLKLSDFELMMPEEATKVFAAIDEEHKGEVTAEQLKAMYMWDGVRNLPKVKTHLAHVKEGFKAKFHKGLNKVLGLMDENYGEFMDLTVLKDTNQGKASTKEEDLRKMVGYELGEGNLVNVKDFTQCFISEEGWYDTVKVNQVRQILEDNEMYHQLFDTSMVIYTVLSAYYLGTYKETMGDSSKLTEETKKMLSAGDARASQAWGSFKQTDSHDTIMSTLQEQLNVLKEDLKRIRQEMNSEFDVIFNKLVKSIDKRAKKRMKFADFKTTYPAVEEQLFSTLEYLLSAKESYPVQAFKELFLIDGGVYNACLAKECRNMVKAGKAEVDFATGLKELLALIDENNDLKIQVEEFQIIPQATQDAFEKLDVEKKGYVTHEQLMGMFVKEDGTKDLAGLKQILAQIKSIQGGKHGNGVFGLYSLLMLNEELRELCGNRFVDLEHSWCKETEDFWNVYMSKEKMTMLDLKRYFTVEDHVDLVSVGKVVTDLVTTVNNEVEKQFQLLISMVDINHDSKIQLEEFELMHEENAAKFFAELDTEGLAFLSQEQVKALFQPEKEKYPPSHVFHTGVLDLPKLMHTVEYCLDSMDTQFSTMFTELVEVLDANAGDFIHMAKFIGRFPETEAKIRGELGYEFLGDSDGDTATCSLDAEEFRDIFKMDEGFYNTNEISLIIGMVDHGMKTEGFDKSFSNLMDLIDFNNDMKIQLEEWEMNYGAGTQDLFTKLDTNKDGVLSPDELKAWFTDDEGHGDAGKLNKVIQDIRLTHKERHEKDFGELQAVVDLLKECEEVDTKSLKNTKYEFQDETAAFLKSIEDRDTSVGILAQLCAHKSGEPDVTQASALCKDLTAAMQAEFDQEFVILCELIDENMDQQIQLSEFEVMLLKDTKEVFDRLDKNKEGVLSHEQLKELFLLEGGQGDILRLKTVIRDVRDSFNSSFNKWFSILMDIIDPAHTSILRMEMFKKLYTPRFLQMKQELGFTLADDFHMDVTEFKHLFRFKGSHRTWNLTLVIKYVQQLKAMMLVHNMKKAVEEAKEEEVEPKAVEEEVKPEPTTSPTPPTSSTPRTMPASIWQQKMDHYTSLPAEEPKAEEVEEVKKAEEAEDVVS